MALGGNWTNNVSAAAFIPGTGTVTFNNTAADQNITGTGTAQTFNSVTVTKTTRILNIAGSIATVSVGGTLTLTSGTIATNATHILSITNTANTAITGGGTLPILMALLYGLYHQIWPRPLPIIFP